MKKVRNENYILIQGFMVNELNLKGNELLVYAIIYGFSQAEEQRFSGSLQYLADWTNSTKQGVIKNLKSLLEKKLIEKEETTFKGVNIVEYYSTKFNGGIKQSLMGIKQSLPNNIVYNINNNIDNNNNNIYNFVEENFGRTLNSIEYEEISSWEDNELTRYAIKQAILKGKYNIKYISTILYNYKKNNIISVQQAQEEEIKFKNKGNKKETSWEYLERIKREYEEEENEKTGSS